MKKMISVFFSFLGLTILSCCTKYGVPYSSYMIKGTVTDENSNPINHIRLTVQDQYNEKRTLYSDENGNYQYESGTEEGYYSLQIIAEDIDGPENGGEFDIQEKLVEGSPRESEKNRISTEVVDFKLSKKE